MPSTSCGGLVLVQRAVHVFSGCALAPIARSLNPCRSNNLPRHHVGTSRLSVLGHPAAHKSNTCIHSRRTDASKVAPRHWCRACQETRTTPQRIPSSRQKLTYFRPSSMDRNGHGRASILAARSCCRIASRFPGTTSWEKARLRHSKSTLSRISPEVQEVAGMHPVGLHALCGSHASGLKRATWELPSTSLPFSCRCSWQA